MAKFFNYIKFSALNASLFTELYKNINSDCKILLFYMAVCSLSKGTVISQFFDLKNKIKTLLKNGRKTLVYETLLMTWIQEVTSLWYLIFGSAK